MGDIYFAGRKEGLTGGNRVMLRERSDRNIPKNEVRIFILGILRYAQNDALGRGRILRYATSRYALVPPLEYKRSSGGAE